MRNYFTYSESIRHFQDSQYEFGKRIPLKLLQAFPCKTEHSEMSGFKKKNLINSSDETSKYVAQNRQKKIMSSLPLKEKASISKPKMYESTIKSAPVYKTTCDLKPTQSNAFITGKNIVLLKPDESKTKITESSDFCISKVGSLTASPKWARIKDKFENGDPTTGSKLSRSSSLPRNDSESLKIKATFTKTSSRSLTSLCSDNSLSTFNKDYSVSDTSYRQMLSVDKSESPKTFHTKLKSQNSDCKSLQKIQYKSNHTMINEAQNSSSSKINKCNIVPTSNKMLATGKTDLNSKDVLMPKSSARSKNIPLSARAAALSLLPVSTRSSNISKKGSPSVSKSNSCVISSKANEDRGYLTSNKQVSSKPSCKSIDQPSEKITRVKSENSKNNSNKFRKNTIAPHLYKSPVHSDSSEESSVTSKTDKKATCLSVPGTNTGNANNISESKLGVANNVKEAQSKVSTLKSIPTISAQHISQFNMKMKNTWVKDNVGNWTKIAPSDKSEVKNSSNVSSKVTVLKNKFSSCSMEGVQEKITTSPLDSKIISLSKSHTTCNVPSKMSEKEFETEQSQRPLCKSNTTSSICTKAFPSHHSALNANTRSKCQKVIGKKVSENKQNNSFLEFRCTQNASSSKIEDGTIINSVENSPEQIRKLSIVQRAVLSYEENLTLSPEMQRKLKLIGEEVKAQTDDDKLFVAKARNDILTLSCYRKNNKQQQDKGQMNDPKWKWQADISSQNDELQQPVRSFLSRYQHMNKNLNTIKDIKVKKLMKESINYVPIENEGICNIKGGKSDSHHTFATSSTKHLTMLSPNTSVNNSLKSNSSVYSNIRCDGGNVIDSGSQFKVTPKPLKGKQDPPVKNLPYMNHLTNESHFLYDRFSSMEQELSVPLQPNASFLWRHSERAQNDCARSTSLSSTKSEGKIDDNYYDLENYYSSLEFDGNISKSNQEEHIYIDSEFNPIYSDKNGSTLLGTKYQNLVNGINQEKIDTDDGWTDLSDEEITTDKAGSKTSTLSSTLKRKKNKKCTKIKGQLHRSWSQSLRDIATADASETSDKQDSTDWANEDYHDPSVWKTNDIGSNSETTDIDHFYEPVYESLGNYLVTQDSDESYNVPQLPDDKISKKYNSSTSIESVGNVKPLNDQCSDVPSDFQPESPDIPDGISKKAGNKIRQLKRHLSWTKNDIRFELTSKFNKIKIRKNLHSATEIGVRVHEDGAAFVSPKKRTFIKCILKQKNPNVPDKRSPSPKKESALFYVHLSMSSEKQRPFSDSCVANISTKGSKNDPTLHKSRKISEPSLQTFNKDQQPVQRLKRGSSGITIQRPKTPPPLPPVKYVPKNIAKSNSDIVANNSSIHRIINKGMSLDSAYKSSNSSDISDKSSMDNASCVNYDIRKSFSVPDSKLPHKVGITEASASQSAQDFVSEIWSEDRESLSSLTSVIDSLSTSDMFFKRTRSSVASSASSISVESYIPPDDSGSSSASSATAYTSSGIIPPVSEISLLHCHGEHTVSVNSDLSLPPFKDLKTELLKSPFEEEPMYQFYHKDAQQRATMWCTTDGSESEFEEDLVNKMQESFGFVDEIVKSPVLQSQLSAMDLVHGDGGQRTLWCEVPEVQRSGILEKISPQDRKIQEAMFEVITSEASYLRSLNFLLEHFVHCPEFSGEFAERHILDKRERHILFSDIQPVRDVSARLLSDLEKRWLENILLSNVCDIIYHHASKYFSVYVKYCSNQLYQDRIIKELKGNRPEFVEVLKRLELSPVCQGLDMHSFVMLPMQRITRLPLLVDAIFHRLPVDSPIYDSCKMALATLNKIVAECNEGARKMERMEEMLIISHQLDFRECKGLGLLSASRWLVKKGELVRLLLDTTNKRTFSRNVRWCKIQLYLFLFTDLLVITRKKSDDNYYVVDYCPRNMVQVIPLDENAHSLSVRPPSHYRNLFQMIMLNNQEGRTVEMLLSCLLESDRTRWMDAVTPAKSENPDEKIYEEWDCPQVQCTHAYTAQQPDELTLEEADVVNVFRKVADGWYEGERIRDGIRGWFPASNTVEIISSHVRARNLRQRYRLLMLSQTYLEDQYRAQMTHGKNK